MRPLACLAVAAAAGLVSCNQPTGSIANDAGATMSAYVAFDLASGRVVPVPEGTSLAAADWSGDRLLFRRLAAGPARVGRPVGDDLAETDEHPQQSIATGELWMGVYEVTQAQWERFGGGSPWYDAIPFFDLGGFVSPDRPALAISAELALRTIAPWSGTGWRLDLPTATEWERACLAGTDTKFSWGRNYVADAEHPDLDAYLVCDSAGAGLTRPQPIGSRLANAWGFHDMHGNAWELVRQGLDYEIRGGAWDSGVLACRASNHVAVDPATAGWDVGLRLVLRR